MPIKAVADAFQARLLANWDETQVVEYDTIAEPPEDVPAFLVQQFPVVNGTRPVLGRTFWEEGVYRLVLNVRSGIGLAQGLTWSDELIALFRDVTFDHVLTFTPDGPVIDDNIEEGDWVSYSIAVPYRYQYDAGIPVVIEAAGSAGGEGG